VCQVEADADHALAQQRARQPAARRPLRAALVPLLSVLCGFVVAGTEGTISSYDYEPAIRVQTEERPEGFEQPVDSLLPPRQNPIQYLLHHLESGEPIEGPLSPALCRIGQQIVDTAARSAREKRTLPLLS